MPIYQYRCSECEQTEEIIEKVDSPNVKQCFHCRGTSQRIFSETAPPKFKGSGFYETDYVKKKR